MDAGPPSPEAPAAPSPVPAGTRLARVVFLRASREDMLALGRGELVLGLLLCCLVGVGRWWDDPAAHWAQRLGLGSLAYVYLLSHFIWLVFWPWRLPDWDRLRLLTYVALTAGPGLLYAFPIEKVAPEAALPYNVCALSAVASWRVALLYRYFRVLGRLARFRAVCATMIPVCAIVGVITWLGAVTGVIDVMGGFRGSADTQALATVSVLLTLALLYPGMFLALYYPVMIVQRLRGIPLTEPEENLSPR